MQLLQTSLGTKRVSQTAVARWVAAKQNRTVTHVAFTLEIEVQPGVSAYASDKAAVMQLTKTMAIELLPRGIGVNGLAPGLFNIVLTHDFVQKPHKGYFDLSQSSSMGEISELDSALLFLNTDAPAYVNGVVLPAESGNHLRGQ